MLFERHFSHTQQGRMEAYVPLSLFLGHFLSIYNRVTGNLVSANPIMCEESGSWSYFMSSKYK